MSAGPLFWVHLAYLDVLMLGATAAFIVSLLRRSRAYGVQAAVLTGAALLPWVTNLGYNFASIPLLGAVDLTPVAFTLSPPRSWPGACSASTCCGWRPVAYRQIVAGMSDAVFAARHVRAPGRDQPRRPSAMLGPGPGPAAGGRGWRCPSGWSRGRAAPRPGEVSLEVEGAMRDYEVQASELPDRHGRPKGRLLVLRDVTDRRRLGARGAPRCTRPSPRIADTLSRSLRPDVLPAPAGRRGWRRPTARPVWGTRSAATSTTSSPRGAAWGFAIGDVSGKGAPAAAVTALARYTLRALSSPGLPARGAASPS